MKNHTPSSAQLSPGWVEHYVPPAHARKAVADYKPKPVDFDDSREGDFGHEPGPASLNQINRATRTEQSRLERAFR